MNIIMRVVPAVVVAATTESNITALILVLEDSAKQIDSADLETSLKSAGAPSVDLLRGINQAIVREVPIEDADTLQNQLQQLPFVKIVEKDQIVSIM